jgi:hypothetical protein
MVYATSKERNKKEERKKERKGYSPRIEEERCQGMSSYPNIITFSSGPVPHDSTHLIN